MKIAYFKNFGSNQLTDFRNDDLVALGQEQTVTAVRQDKADIGYTDPRDQRLADLTKIVLPAKSIVVFLQAGNFNPGQQTIEVAALRSIPNLLVCDPAEERTELHFHQDLLHIKSSFLAVKSFNEAVLMAESGSGYFLMNEQTATAIQSDKLQKMFLLSHGKQLKQKRVLIVKKDKTNFEKTIGQLKRKLA